MYVCVPYVHTYGAQGGQKRVGLLQTVVNHTLGAGNQT